VTQSAARCRLRTWPNCAASDQAARTRCGDGKSAVQEGPRPNCSASWRWLAIGTQSWKTSTYLTASISTKKTGRRAGRLFEKRCATRFAGVSIDLLAGDPAVGSQASVKPALPLLITCNTLRRQGDTRRRRVIDGPVISTRSGRNHDADYPGRLPPFRRDDP
jgi:hypothetical protein